MDFNILVRLEMFSVHCKLTELFSWVNSTKGIPTNDYTLHSVGVDFGFSSSATAIVLTEFLKEERKIRVLYSWN